jgi:hypothetical protein
MTDAEIEILHSLDQLEKIMAKWVDTPVIKPVLTNATGPNWLLKLAEEWPNDVNNGDSSLLEKCVEWTDNMLNNWEGCRKLARNMWHFKSKHDAEKFLILFHLKWSNT